jgi:tRNA-dihydrouridine synthase B
MDGVTDAAFRRMVDTIGKPGLLVTEFTAVEAISRGKTAVLDAFRKHPTTTPTLAQVFGNEPESFYQAGLVVSALGFDGIDINMGCPAKNVSQRGAGAGLIQAPSQARKIIQSTKTAIRDWENGISLEQGGVHPSVISWINATNPNWKTQLRTRIPVSVKTRTGFDVSCVKDWIPVLIEEHPDALAVHGRTLKQLYSGLADWEEIGKAAEMARTAGIPILGNGDIKSREQALTNIKTYNLDGVLIGRAVLGNPWIFLGRSPTLQERVEAGLIHSRYFSEVGGRTHFLSMSNHLSWYCRDLPDASVIRSRLMQVETYVDVDAILIPILRTLVTES